MRCYDVIVVGGGLLGCFTARALKRYDVSVALLEAREDVCTGLSRANSALVYGSQDNKPGTMKADVCRRANESFDTLCAQLGVRFERRGSLMVCFGENGLRKLNRGLERGAKNGVSGLRILDRREALELEPTLNPDVFAALYAENTGTVNPWELCLAAAENAVMNGAELRLRERVLAVRRDGGGYVVVTGREEYRCRCLVNCAGLGAEAVDRMLDVGEIGLEPTRADYIVLDEKSGRAVRHVLFYEPETRGKGIAAVPTTDGNLMLGPSEMQTGDAPAFETAEDGIRFIREQTRLLLPHADTENAVRFFSTARPNPFCRTDTGGERRSIDDFPILLPKSDPGYIGFTGIKTPGMTCAELLGRFAADRCAAYLRAGKADFDPVRRAGTRFSELTDDQLNSLIARDEGWGRIVCTCKNVTEGEIRSALRSQPPCTTVDGVKRRTGCCLGACQGSRCTERIVELIAEELGVPAASVEKGGEGSWIIR